MNPIGAHRDPQDDTMEQSPPRPASGSIGPKFYLTGRQPLRPTAVLLAILAAGAGISVLAFGLGQQTGLHADSNDPRGSRSAHTAPKADADADEDPNQVDTIVVGDPADAPVPARPGTHISSVHATILIHLPRYGDQAGLIPDTPAGHLLFSWLAAFNQASETLLQRALPNAAPESAAAAQMQLRRKNGGFNLLSAREIQPGILVFRLRDQTPQAGETLGILQLRLNSSPATAASFSLRAVPSPATDHKGAR